MAEQYYLSDHDGKRFGPLTLDELNAESRKGRLKIPGSTNLDVAGTSLSRAARNIDGLILHQPVVETGPWPTDPRVQVFDKAAGTLLGVFAIFIAVVRFQQSGRNVAVDGSVVAFYLLIAYGIFSSKKAGFYGGIFITSLTSILTILIFLESQSKELVLADYAGIPALLFCVYCILRVRMKYVPTAIGSLEIDHFLRQEWASRTSV